MSLKANRRESSSNVAGIVDVYEIDFTKNDKPKKLVSSMLQCNVVSVNIQTLGCTSLAGNWVIEQSVQSNGKESSNMAEGSLTIAAATTGNSAIAKGSLTMEYVVVTLPATLATAGKAIVTITGKRG